jgi:uncharacterized protein YgiB involved in biofilm formation
MKRSRAVALLSMGASALVLAACESSDAPVETMSFATIEECVADGRLGNLACEDAFYAARDGYEAAYPKFADKAGCEDMAGEGECEEDRPNSRNSSWRPMMIGFLAGMSRVQPQAVIPNAAAPDGRSTASGAHVRGNGPSVTVPASARSRPTGAAVAAVATSSRGGFGGTASAMSASSGHGSGSHSSGG